MTQQLRFAFLLFVLTIVMAIAGRASAAAVATRNSAASAGIGMKVSRFARHLLGIPYRYGGSSPSTGFDCSGFVRFVYQHFGVALPHSSYADFNLGTRVSRGDLRPGDLVFFDGVGHVGLYIGNGRFIHAPHTGLSVMVTSLSSSWYVARYDGARRLAVKVAQRMPVRIPRPEKLKPLARWLAHARA